MEESKNTPSDPVTFIFDDVDDPLQYPEDLPVLFEMVPGGDDIVRGPLNHSFRGGQSVGLDVQVHLGLSPQRIFDMGQANKWYNVRISFRLHCIKRDPIEAPYISKTIRMSGPRGRRTGRSGHMLLPSTGRTSVEHRQDGSRGRGGGHHSSPGRARPPSCWPHRS